MAQNQMAKAKDGSRPNYGAQVTVQSVEEKYMAKQIQKEAKRNRNKADTGFEDLEVRS